MSYATLMVHIELGQTNTPLLKVTRDLAKRVQAKVVIGIAVCQPIRIIYSDGYVPGDVIEQDRQEIDQQMKAAEAEFRAALSGHVGTIEWRSAVTFTSLSAHLAQEACAADLVITGVDRNASVFDNSRHVDIGDLVMEAGRPCLVLPASTENVPLSHVVVGWKDTSETRRAIADALPLLQIADQVSVVQIAPEPDLPATRLRLEDVVAWLNRHGIQATSIAAPSVGDDAVRLDSILTEQGADLVVAGAYGHSRMREWALGGVTRDLLLRAGRCALVSH